MQTYDWNNRVLTVTAPGAATVHLAYSATRKDGGASAVTDEEDRTSSYVRSNLMRTYGGITRVVLPDSGTDSFGFDLLGHPDQRTRATGRTVDEERDAGGRPVRIAYGGSGTTGVVTTTYDTLGRVTEVTDFSGASSFEHDTLGTPLAEIRHPDPLHTYGMHYGHDGLGYIGWVRYPDQTQVVYHRSVADPRRLEQVTAVTTWSPDTVLARDFTYTAGGLLTGYTLGNGVRCAIERGPGGRPDRLTATTGPAPGSSTSPTTTMPPATSRRSPTAWTWTARRSTRTMSATAW